MYTYPPDRIEDYKKDKIEKFRIKNHWCRRVDFWDFGFKSHFLHFDSSEIIV